MWGGLKRMRSRLGTLVYLVIVVAFTWGLAWTVTASPCQADPRVFTPEDFSGGPTPSAQPRGAKADWARFPLEVRLDKKQYRIGDLMGITITAAQDCYITVYYVSARGQTAVICPSPFSPNHRLWAGRPFVLLDSQGRKMEQTGPAGTEHLQVIASEEPLDLATLHGLKPPPGGVPTSPPPAQAAGKKPASTASHPASARPSPAPTTLSGAKPANRPTPSRPSASPSSGAKPASRPSPAQVSGGDPTVPKPATRPTPARPSTAVAHASTGGAKVGQRPQWNTPPAGHTTVEVSNPNEFVDDVARAIRSRVASRTAELKNGLQPRGGASKAGCYGFASVRYTVTR